ncbi:uncharacterized protein LOC135702130 [Ochlerotatus camptorhynchus]|uniref:uncharacterized protein LOC135702130 n=1 Tax=Ochlerotatus camptorhynchus TaxID=644619 RepID=UPI0031D50955
MVLLRFRQKRVAFSGDHQFLIRKKDKQAQRNAEEYADQFPDTARAIIENHYVDDYLDSVETVEEAVELIEEVKHVHSKAGMEIRNFSSNSSEVLERIGETSKVQQKSLNLDSDVERVLALIGSRLLDSVCKALTLPVAAQFLCSDSTTVLAWLKSETRRYHQFVGFRVGEIPSTTTVDEWRKVQSKVNVADQSTKWRDGPSFRPDDWWYVGPAFLMEPDESWRKENSEEYSTAEEQRAVFLHHRVISPLIIDVQRFSKWSRLQRTTGYVVRATKVFLGLHAEGPLTQEELLKAEAMIFQQVQKHAYADEYVTLSYNNEHPDAEPKQIARSSALYKLSPMLDDDGVLRMNSRIAAAPMVTKDARFPIFLPKSHRVTELLVEWASNLFKEQLKAITEHCAVTFTNVSTRWLFNPPLAPHMGGPWERMVRSVKVAMAAIADHPHHPSDEVLETVALEAESIVNSRPLTYIPLDHADQAALTPNHFLLYETQGINQPSRDLQHEYATLRDSLICSGAAGYTNTYLR